MKSWKTILGVAVLAALPLSSVRAQPKPGMARAVTLTGLVAGTPQDGQFFLRANGETYRVRPLPEVNLSSIAGGDRVRVFGRPTGLRINYANVRVLQQRASDNPTDYNPTSDNTPRPTPRTQGNR